MVTQFNTIFGHFTASMFVMTSGTKSNWNLFIGPLKSIAKLTSSTLRGRGVSLYYNYFSLYPHTVEKLNEHRNYNEFSSNKVFTQSYSLGTNLLQKFRFSRHFLYTSLFQIWNSGEPNAKHSTQCCPSWKGICGALWSPDCKHHSFWWDSSILSPGFPCLSHRVPKTLR